MRDTPQLTRVHHATIYRYDHPVALGPHVVRLRPAPAAAERIAHYSLRVSPEPAMLRWQQDPAGNWIARLVFDARTSALRLDVDVLVDMAPINPFDFLVEPSAEGWPLTYLPEMRRELVGTLEPEAAGPLLTAYLDACRALPANSTLPFLVALNRDLHERVRYITRPVGEVQPPDETLALAAGSCRDSAWLLVQVLRHLGGAARFVSGYLVPLDAPGAPQNPDAEPGGAGAGLHAWATVYLPGAGWVGLDPTSGTWCGEAYLPLAATAHHANAAPVTGTSEPTSVDLSFEFYAGRA